MIVQRPDEVRRSHVCAVLRHNRSQQCSESRLAEVAELGEGLECESAELFGHAARVEVRSVVDIPVGRVTAVTVKYLPHCLVSFEYARWRILGHLLCHVGHTALAC